MTTIISFVPALHAGYINFFKKYPDTLYLLHSDFIKEWHRLERDIRQIDAYDMKKAIDALGILREVKVLHIDELPTLKIEGEIVMPDEDITREIKEKYFSTAEVAFENIFLRWHKQVSLQDQPQGLVMSSDQFDKDIMKRAVEESAKSSDWYRQIGVVLLKNGEPILIGHNSHQPSDMSLDVYGDPRSSYDAGVRFDLSSAIHGEASVIGKAARKGISLEGCSIYVTTFPCPACAKLIAEAGIKKVYYLTGYSLLDAETVLKSYGIEIIMVQLEN